MIDFHSHILPNVDDGSKSVEESVEMLRMLKAQGVTKVIATPHFYANHNSVDEFLIRRDNSFTNLSRALTLDLPDIILGAEVKYYEGISRLEQLNKLRIGNSKLILLEMPFRNWTNFTLRELRDISNSGNVTVVIAHIERYLGYQNKGIIEDLVRSGILIQANAEFFTSIINRKKAVSMLKNNMIHFIGSDCHNLSSRAPNFDKAVSYIQRKAGNNMLLQIENLATGYLYSNS